MLAAPRVNLAQLVNRVDGKVDRLSDPIVTNLARLVMTLDQDGVLEGGITIAPMVHEVVGSIALNFNQASTDAGRDDAKAEDPKDAGTVAMVSFASNQTISFASDPTVTALMDKLNSTPGVFTAHTPRRLFNAAPARNELRRNIRGIIKLTDVKIPLRDGVLRLRGRLPPGRRRAASDRHERGFLRQELRARNDRRRR